MPYLPTIVLAVAGLLGLAALLIRFSRGLRRFRLTMSMVSADYTERTGLLKARSAGLRVAFAQRLPGHGRQVESRERL